MEIDFSAQRRAAVQDAHERWWTGSLGRPIVHVTVRDDARHGPPPPGYHPHWTAFYPDDTPADRIVDDWTRALASRDYLADAFPCVWPNFGPGVVAAFLGARLSTSPEAGTVWFEPLENRAPDALRFAFDPDNPWLKRIAGLMRTAAARFGGRVQIGMTDLGGNLDVLSSFRPSVELLTDLYDAPAHVRRLTWEIHESWWRAFNILDAAVRDVNPGYTSWTPLLSSAPSYMLQCDFAYMIGPAMFDAFVRPELAASAARLGGRAFYHLDGTGELPHLDSLLSIPDLAGIQWVPGAGDAMAKDWTDIYRRIRAAGRLAQVTGVNPDGFSRLVDALGADADGLFYIADFPAARRAEAEAFVRRHGA